MFDTSIIKTEFIGLVGLRQNDDPDYPAIASNLIYDGSNTLVQHPLINIENLSLTSKNYSKLVYPAWSNVTAYPKGSRVSRLNVNYEARRDTTNNAPESSPLDWAVVDALSDYLMDIYQSTSEFVVSELFNKKRELDKTKTLIQNLRFYEGAGNLNDKLMNEGKMVGVMFKLKAKQNLVAVIERIGLQLNAAQTGVKFYLYHSSKPTALLTSTVNHTVGGGFQWHTITPKMKLHHLNNLYDAGGYFFIMYDQNDLLGSMAINKRMNFHLTPCGSCSPYNGQTFQKVTPYIELRSCHVPATSRVSNGNLSTTGVDLWDIEQTRFDSDINWGLNFDLTVRCDLTEFIVQQKDVFKEALRDNFIVRLIDNMANSTRVNNIEARVSQLAQMALSSEKLGGGGLRDIANKRIENINFELSGLDNVCMPCANKNGVRIKTFGLQ